MPGTNSESTIGVSLTVVKNEVVPALKNTSEEARKAEAQMRRTATGAGGLGAALKSLGVAALAYQGLGILFNVVKDGAKSMLEDESATRALTGTLTNLGLESEKTKKQIDDFVEAQGKLGQGGSDTENGLAKLVSITGDVSQAITLSALASDLAASHMGTYAENVDLLQTILMGKGQKALEAYGIRMAKNSTVSEQLIALNNRVTTTQEQLADTTEGQINRLNEIWSNFKTNLAKIGLWFGNTFVVNWVDDMATMGRAVSSVAKTVVDDWVWAINGIEKAYNNGLKKKSGGGLVGAMAGNILSDKGIYTPPPVPPEIKAGAAAANAAKNNGRISASLLDAIGKGYKTQAEEGVKGADKTKDAFREMSKAVLDALRDQQKEIDNLSAAQKKLTTQLDEDIAKSNEKYQTDATEIARRAKQRIEEIGKQIEDENSTMSEGFRGRIEELKAEMAKEQAIIDQAGTINANLKQDIAKNDLQILQDSHEKELAEIRSQNEKKRKEAEDEINARKFQINRIGANLYDPNFYKNSSAEANSFLGSIGQGQMQQALVFNFNGTVAGDEGVKEIITQAISEINRQATVQKVGGK